MPPNVRSFDSVEAMMRDITANERAANDAATERQRTHLAVAAGNPTYAFHVYEGLLIVGETQTPRARAERESELGSEDFDHDLANFTATHERGYLNGRWYSIVEPTGELGGTHVANVVWIDPLVFNGFRDHGWSMERMQAEMPFIQLAAVMGNLRSNIMDTYPGTVLP